MEITLESASKRYLGSGVEVRPRGDRSDTRLPLCPANMRVLGVARSIFQASLPAAVTLAQFLACFMLPIVVATLTRGGAVGASMLREVPVTDPQQLRIYVILAILVAGATALATASLSHVAYTTKIAFKSSKLVPTIIISAIFGGRQHAARTYVGAVLLCIGATVVSSSLAALRPESGVIFLPSISHPTPAPLAVYFALAFRSIQRNTDGIFFRDELRTNPSNRYSVSTFHHIGVCARPRGHWRQERGRNWRGRTSPAV